MITLRTKNEKQHQQFEIVFVAKVICKKRLQQLQKEQKNKEEPREGKDQILNSHRH